MGVWQILPFWLGFTIRLRWVWVCVANNVWRLNCLFSHAAPCRCTAYVCRVFPLQSHVRLFIQEQELPFRRQSDCQALPMEKGGGLFHNDHTVTSPPQNKAPPRGLKKHPKCAPVMLHVRWLLSKWCCRLWNGTHWLKQQECWQHEGQVERFLEVTPVCVWAVQKGEFFFFFFSFQIWILHTHRA